MPHNQQFYRTILNLNPCDLYFIKLIFLFILSTFFTS